MSWIPKVLLAAFLVAGAVTSCAPKEPALTAEQIARCERLGQEAAQALGKNLLSQLQGALANGDLTGAIAVCQLAAEPITKATSDQTAIPTSSRDTITERRSPDAAIAQATTTGIATTNLGASGAR